jgi:hypothetical protein
MRPYKFFKLISVMITFSYCCNVKDKKFENAQSHEYHNIPIAYQSIIKNHIPVDTFEFKKNNLKFVKYHSIEYSDFELGLIGVVFDENWNFISLFSRKYLVGFNIYPIDRIDTTLFWNTSANKYSNHLFELEKVISYLGSYNLENSIEVIDFIIKYFYTEGRVSKEKFVEYFKPKYIINIDSIPHVNYRYEEIFKHVYNRIDSSIIVFAYEYYLICYELHKPMLNYKYNELLKRNDVDRFTVSSYVLLNPEVFELIDEPF